MEIALVNSSILKTTYRVQLLKYYEIICCNSYMINLKAELAQSRFIFPFSWTSLSVSILNSNFQSFYGYNNSITSSHNFGVNTKFQVKQFLVLFPRVNTKSQHNNP